MNHGIQLSKFGIEFLTGESCAIGMRGLYDLTKQGETIVKEFLGLNAETKLANNWNSGSSSDPHVSSVMLTHSMALWLGAYCLLTRRKPCAVILSHGNQLWWMGQEDLDEEIFYKRLEKFIERNPEIVLSEILKNTIGQELSTRNKLMLLANIYITENKIDGRIFCSDDENSRSIAGRNVHGFSGRSA